MRICPSGMFPILRTVGMDNKEVEGGRFMRAGDGRLCFNDK